MRSPFDTFHIQIVLSQDSDAKYSPFGENTTLKTQWEWPVRVLIRFPLDILHTPIVLSLDPDAKYSPFGENTAKVVIEGFDSLSARYPPHSDSIVWRSRCQIFSVLRLWLYFVDFEGFDLFSTRYPPHSDSTVMRSRRQILSVRRKYYAWDLWWVSWEGFDLFSARYSPHSDNTVIRSRCQILSIRRKYDSTSEGFDMFSARRILSKDPEPNTLRLAKILHLRLN